MLTAPYQTNEQSAVLSAAPLSLPRWLAQLGNRPDAKRATVAPSRTNGLIVSFTRWDQLLLVSVNITNAKKLVPLALQRRVVDAYTAIRQVLSTGEKWQLIRIWNWIPDIHADMAAGMNRYMVFNAGRFTAFFDWYRMGTEFEGSIATATGVGHDGSDLVIHALAANTAGQPVENPRQIQSYCYSNQFGPMPPCFARATLTPKAIKGLPSLLIGGTASVCGEATKHVGVVVEQTKETLQNLAHVISEGARVALGSRRSSAPVDVASELRRLNSVRVYYQYHSDQPAIRELLQHCLNHLDASRIEWTRADICRPELMVEIEGTASFG